MQYGDIGRFADAVFDSMSEAFCVLDSSFRVVGANRAFADLWMRPHESMKGRVCFEVLAGRDNDCKGCVARQSFKSGKPGYGGGLVIEIEGREVLAEMSSHPVRLNAEGEVSHIIVYIRDVTEERRTARNSNPLVKGLTEAFSGQHETGGLLPMCAWCKRIRDYQGYWEHLERFLEKSSETLFSHGICPECMERMAHELERPGEEPEG